MKAALGWFVALSFIGCGFAQMVIETFEGGNAESWVVTEGIWSILSPGAAGSNFCFGSNSLTSETYYEGFRNPEFDLEVYFWIDDESVGNFDIEFNYRDSANYYMIDMADPDSDDPTARIYRYIDGVETILDEIPNVIEAGTWERVAMSRGFWHIYLIFPDHPPAYLMAIDTTFPPVSPITPTRSVARFASST